MAMTVEQFHPFPSKDLPNYSPVEIQGQVLSPEGSRIYSYYSSLLTYLTKIDPRLHQSSRFYTNWIWSLQGQMALRDVFKKIDVKFHEIERELEEGGFSRKEQRLIRRQVRIGHLELKELFRVLTKSKLICSPAA